MKKILFSYYLFIIFLLLSVFSQTASAQDNYKFQSMIPALQQPWYFSSPTGVAICPDGSLLVSDTANHRIHKFNPEGQLITTWGKYGHNEGEFNSPGSIGVDSCGNIYVVDTNNHRIEKFDQHQNFILSWGSQGSGEGEFTFVTGKGDIAVDADDNIYVADYRNNRIQKFDPQGTFIGFAGENYSCPLRIDEYCGETCFLYYPSAIAFDSSGNLYVANQGSDVTRDDRIIKFSESGEFILSFGGSGENDGELFNPCGMVFDDEDNLYIADSSNHRIQIFSTDGFFVDTFGTRGLHSGEFDEPVDIAMGKDGKIYVADKNNNRIEKFSRKKVFINSWASRGADQGKFNNPLGIETDKNDYIYIADTDNHRIQKLDSNGSVLLCFGESGEKDGQFNRPYDLAVDLNGNIFVADTNNHRIQKFDSNGNFITSWGTYGAEGVIPEFPVGIDVDNSGSVYVAIKNNPSIQKFSNNGGFLKKWGETGNEEGKFSNPFGIAVDNSGNVYVSDYDIPESGTFHRIQKFTSDGEFLISFGEYGADPGQFNVPRGIDTDSNGNVYVADMWNYRIQKFTSQGEFIESMGEFGSGPGQFTKPTDIAVTADGGLCVVDSLSNRVEIFNKTTGSVTGKIALVVAGGGPYSSNTLWDTTRTCANFAYRTLLFTGYLKENIYYLTYDQKIDLDGNGLFDDIYGEPTEDNIKKIITEIASRGNELFIYFVDHGKKGSFCLSETSQLSAETLDQWLDTCEGLSSGKTLLVYDACRSGSFLSSLTPYAENSRTVITSSATDQYAYFVSLGTISFSEYFWTALFNGHDLNNSFLQASRGITTLQLSQTPQIDANGNGIGNEDEDYCLAFERFSDSKDIVSGDIPVIGDVSAMTLVDETGKGEIIAKSSGDNGISRVWATIIPPDYNPGDPDIPVTDIPEIELEFEPDESGESGEYKAWYNEFSKPGEYIVTIYARDTQGNNSKPVTTAFVTQTDYLPKAVIVTSEISDPVISSIYKYLGDHAFNALKTQGFSDERIYILNKAKYSDIEYAITNWASDTDNLTVFFTGKAENSIFYLTGDEKIAASTLNTFFDQYQETTSGNLNFILDADCSGSFVNDLKNSTNSDRIVVTSTTDSGKSYFENLGLVSFGSYFWNNIFKGYNIKDAFLLSKNAVEYISQSYIYLNLDDSMQIPQIDDNGNGIANEDSDGNIAAKSYIGIGIMTAENIFLNGDVTDKITLNGEISAMLSIENIQSAEEIERVWALITPPEYTTDQNGIISLPVLNLIPMGHGNYQWMYSDFSMAGKYTADYFAMDNKGAVSLLGSSTITQLAEPKANVIIGEKAGTVTEFLSKSLDITLMLNTTIDPEISEDILSEWVVVATGSLEGKISFYLFSPSGFVDITAQGINLSDYTFPFDHTRETMALATVNLEELGLNTGDFLAYAYVYTTAEDLNDIFDPLAVFKNIVFISIL